ncbi:hypothetical protein K502DRAFT_351348 [Neoconidiobolus thromboides FSU 785]|nr:hypothetical protein K502DRAFT_351348 [Neoconidiobolus thromboides FSU 785]
MSQTKQTLNHIWYFAYGSNMYSKILTDRRKVKPVRSLPAVAKGYKLTFDLFGFPYFEPSFGNIIKINDINNSKSTNESSALIDNKSTFTDNIDVEGVLHLITEEDYSTIRRTEGGNGNKGYGYQDIKIECTSYEGETIEASTLLCISPNAWRGEARPSHRYLNLLIEGAKENNISPNYQTYLNNLPYFQLETNTQMIGKYLMLVIMFPFILPMLLIFTLSTLTKFQPPVFVSVYMDGLNKVMWVLHDRFLKPCFGTGE